MTSNLLKFSKSKVDQAGEVLKNNTSTKEEITKALDILSSWRSHHASPLKSLVTVLRKRALQIDSTALAAQRLKRTSSIILKLSRQKTMRLSAMQDIGGARVVLKTTQDVTKLFNVYRKSRSKHRLFAVDDYIKSPKEDGYRSLHLIYKIAKTPSLFLEIQMRTELQHVWATGVEVFGTLRESHFKSGQGSKEWLEFFALLSSLFALKEKKPTLKKHSDLTKEELLFKVQEKINHLQAIENLHIYTAAYRVISKNALVGRIGHFNLITLNSRDKTIRVENFGAKNFKKVSRAYLHLEKKYLFDRHINIVLVNTEDIRKLELSYPNYFMDTRRLVQNLSLIATNNFF